MSSLVCAAASVTKPSASSRAPATLAGGRCSSPSRRSASRANPISVGAARRAAAVSQAQQLVERAVARPGCSCPRHGLAVHAERLAETVGEHLVQIRAICLAEQVAVGVRGELLPRRGVAREGRGVVRVGTHERAGQVRRRERRARARRDPPGKLAVRPHERSLASRRSHTWRPAATGDPRRARCPRGRPGTRTARARTRPRREAHRWRSRPRRPRRAAARPHRPSTRPPGRRPRRRARRRPRSAPPRDRRWRTRRARSGRPRRAGRSRRDQTRVIRATLLVLPFEPAPPGIFVAH